MAAAAPPVDRLAGLGAAACRSHRPRPSPAAPGRPSRARRCRRRRAPRAPPGRCGSRRLLERGGDRARCRVGGAGAISVLVIVAPFPVRARRAGGRRGCSRRGRRARSRGDRSRVRAGGRGSPRPTCSSAALRHLERHPASRRAGAASRPGRSRRSRPARPARSSRPGGTSTNAEIVTPATEASRPATIAPAIVARKPRANCCAVATGTTSRALTRSRPTVRIATLTVTGGDHRDQHVVEADRQAHRRAKSSSLDTANSCGISARQSTITMPARATVTRRRRTRSSSSTRTGTPAGRPRRSLRAETSTSPPARPP